MSNNQHDIQTIIADVLRDTGVRLDADDPVVAMIFAQKRELAKLLQENDVARSERQAEFLQQFAAQASDVVAAAQELQANKNKIIAEILQANEQDISESRLYEKVAAHVQQHNQSVLAEILATNKQYLLMVLIVVLVLQIIGVILGKVL